MSKSMNFISIVALVFSISCNAFGEEVIEIKDDLLINRQNSKGLYGKAFTAGAHGVQLRIVPSTVSYPVFNVQVYDNKEFVSLKLGSSFSSVAYLPKKNLLYLATFNTHFETDSSSFIDKNGLYVYDFSKKNVNELLGKQKGQVTFYEIEKISNGKPKVRFYSLNRKHLDSLEEKHKDGKGEIQFGEVFDALKNSSNKLDVP